MKYAQKEVESGKKHGFTKCAMHFFNWKIEKFYEFYFFTKQKRIYEDTGKKCMF